MTKKMICPKCGCKTIFGSKTMWSMCAACFLAESSKSHLMDAASWKPPVADPPLASPLPDATLNALLYNYGKGEPPVYGKGLIQELMGEAAAAGGAYNPPQREWTAKDLAEHDFTKVERDLFKMTVEDVILDFGFRVWEAL